MYTPAYRIPLVPEIEAVPAEVKAGNRLLAAAAASASKQFSYFSQFCLYFYSSLPFYFFIYYLQSGLVSAM